MRSLRDGTLSHDEAAALARFTRGDYPRSAVDFVVRHARAGENVDIRVHDGTLAIDGDFARFRDWASYYVLLVVDGDLVVDGLYHDSEHEPESIVVVTGSLRARDLVSSGFLEVHGDLIVEHQLVGSGNDCSTEIFGNLRTDFLSPGYHHFKVHGRAEAARATANVASTNQLATLDDAQVIALIDPALLHLVDHEEVDDDGNPTLSLDGINEHAIANRVRSGGVVFR